MNIIKRFGVATASIALAFSGLMVLAPSASASDKPAPSPSQSSEDCVKASAKVIAHTWDKATGTAVVTNNSDKKLCDGGLYVGSFMGDFINPENGAWPQDFSKPGDVKVLVDPGQSVTVTAPAGCGQRDGYAQIGSAPKPAPILYGPQKPYEPKFIHDFSKGPKTWGQDDPASCVKAPPVIMPKATIGQICEIGQSSAVPQYDNGMNEIEMTYNTVVSDGRSFTDVLAPSEVKERMFTFTGTVTVTITATDGTNVYELLEQQLSDENCTSETPTPTPSETTPTKEPSSPPATSSVVPPTSTTNSPPPTLAETGASEEERPALIRNAIIGGTITLIGIIAMAWGYKKPKMARH